MELPIHLYPRGGRPTTAEERAVNVVRARLEPYSQRIRRVGVRLAPGINSRGDMDQACRVEVMLVKVLDAPKFFVEGRASSGHEAAELAADAALGAVRREVERAERRRERTRKGRAQRTGRASKLLEVARAEESETVIEEPRAPDLEAQRRHLTPRRVKTAHPLRGRHIHKTQRQARATSAGEVTRARPSRKSTRKSANRSKRDSNLARRTAREARSPEARAAARH